MFGIARSATWMVAVAAAAALGAMLRYPGGTPRDVTSAGYSLSHNFLSDLGMSVGYNHAPNRLGALLFVVSLLLLVVGLGGAVVVTARYLATNAISRRYAWLAALAAVAVCVCFAGVALTPENRVMALHVTFTMWAWRIAPFAAFFLGVASYHQEQLRRRAALAWFGAALLLAGYAVLISWGPSVLDARGLVVQVIAQKVATVLVVGAVLVGAAEIDRANRRLACS